MSCCARFKTIIIGSKGLLPKDSLEFVLNNCCNKLKITINNNSLFYNNKNVGTITVGERVVVRYLNSNDILEKMRDCFTEYAAIEQANYFDNLKIEKEKIEKEQNDLNELKRSLESIDKKIDKSNEAMKRQKLDSCEAMKLELIEAAREKGYDVIEEANDEGVQLQFVKIEY